MDIINLLRRITGFVVGTETPYFYESKVEHYEKRVYPTTLERFKDFIELSPSFNTSQQIMFRRIPFNSSKEEIKNILNTPRFEIKKKLNGIPYHVLFYKELIGKHNLYSQLHLLDDQYFYSSFSINPANQQNLDHIKGLILEKYNIPPDEMLKDSLCISDQNNNKIICEIDVYFRFCYFTGNAAFLKQLNDLITQYQIKENKSILISEQEVKELIAEI